jgi:hypothetical protein
MLIYLDPSNFAHLELLRDKDPQALAQFFQLWREKGLRLALSLHHAQEVAQLADDASRNRRLDVIRLFPKISYAPIGSVALTQEEIEFQSFAITRRTSFPVEMLGRLLFSDGLAAFLKDAKTKENVESFNKFFEFRRAIGQAEADLTRATAEIKQLQKEGRLPPPQVPAPDFDWEALGHLMESSFPPGIDRSDLGRVIMENTRGLFTAMREEKNQRRALVRSAGLKELPIATKVPDEDLVEVGGFFSLARIQLSSLGLDLGIPESQMLTLLPRLDPYQSPGFRLKLAVERARKRARQPTKSGDLVDSDHIMFAPYCDLIFVDKRTYAYARQEERDRPSLLPPGSTDHLRRAASVEDLLKALGIASSG